MCEYDPACNKADDPLTAELWAARAWSRADLLVVCPPAKCPLAALVTMPTLGQVLWVPADISLAGSVFVDPPDKDAVVHWHALLRPLARWGDRAEMKRCEH